MSARDPGEIWSESAEEGERRLNRGTLGLAATGVVGGIDVMLGVMSLVVVSGALATAVPDPIAHIAGSMAFGIGFVMIAVGRSELFTENFLVPIAAIVRRRGRVVDLLRLWGITMLANIAALLVLAWILTRAGLVPPEALTAAGKASKTFADRDAGSAFLSAVVGGTVMTVFTWLTHAAESDGARVLLAMLIGFVLAAPSLNHAIVSVGEMSFGILTHGPEKATWTDLAQNFPIAVAGNLVGGLGFVTLTRILQVQGEPD